MPKINKEEYQILKGLDDKWKWIARDENYDASLFCFEDKPYKSMKIGAWGPTVVHYEYLGRHDSKFQFIQWDDEEPYSIAGLIEEYEDKEFYDYVGWEYHKNEETEMKKDLGWAKIEIHKELDSWRNVEGGIDGDGINNILNIIDQLDEPEVKQLDKKIRELESYNDELIRDNNQLRNVMDNQEVLSQDWITENSVEGDFRGVQEFWYGEFIEKEKVQNLLVPKQKLPVIPQWVADNIEDKKRVGVLLSVAIAGFPEFKLQKELNIDEHECNEIYARAWLDGYTVEKEPLYRARLKVITDEFIASYLRTQSSDAEDRLKALEIGSKYIHEDYRHLSEFTEDELKRLDIWDSEHWEVEELEE